MQVTYIGNFNPEFSTENDIRKAFECIGWDVIQLQENQTTIQQIYDNSINSDLLLITGTWDDALPLEGMIDVFHELSVRGIPSATYHLDTFWGTKRGGRKWWRHPMFHTAYIFTVDGDYDKHWELFGANHIWLPPAVRHDAVLKGKYTEEYACDVAFVGSNGQGYHEDVWGYRRQLVDKLREICLKNNWSFKNPGGDQPKIERSSEMNNFYASAKVTVGDSLCLAKEKSKYWSDRVPECWGRNGFLIMPKLNALKAEGYDQPFYEWGDFNDLENSIKYFLENVEIRENIRNNNFEFVKKKHTYVNRVQTIIETVL